MVTPRDEMRKDLVTTHDWPALFHELRELGGLIPPDHLAKMSDVPEETVKRWMRTGYAPKRRPSGDNASRLLRLLDILRAGEVIMGHEDKAEEAPTPAVASDVDDVYRLIADREMDEVTRVCQLEALAAAFRARAADREAIAAGLRARAMIEAERAAGARAQGGGKWPTAPLREVNTQGTGSESR
jgi:hypothetical protein